MAKIVRRKSADMDKFLKAGNRGRLIPPLERHLVAREPEFRRSDIIHPSALSKSDWCPRAQWFWLKGYPLPKDRVGRQSQSIFDEGHHIHNKYQQWLWDMKVLYGVFQCLVCKDKWWDQSPTHCSTCGARRRDGLLRYAEVPFEVPEWQMAGHADGWVKGCGDDFILEIKSVGTGTVRIESPTIWDQYGGDIELIWRNLKHPFASHLKQANLYCAMVNETQEDGPKEILFLYESKFNQSAKEFVVPFNPRLVQPLINGAKLVKQHMELGTPPPCPEDGCGTCKNYEVAA